MNHCDLVEKLESRVKKRRIILGILSFLFVILAVVFSVLYSNTRTVETIDYFFGKTEKISYNYTYVWGIVTGIFGAFFTVALLISDLLFSKLFTVDVNGNSVTYYKGLVKNELYVNGEYRDGGAFMCYYLEATLSDLTKVCVSVGKWNSRITFSNGHPSYEI